MAKNDEKENKQKRHYFKDMKAELKKVVWPTPKQTMNNTIAVIVFTLLIAAIVFVLDLCFDSIHKYGVTPLQEKIQSSYSSKNGETTENEDNETSENDAESSDANSDEQSENKEETNTEVEDNTNSGE